jgi:hypothetical protein
MTTTTTTETLTRKYTVAYQLGGRGTTHNKISAALNAVAKARRAAKRGGDLQGVRIEVTEYKDGRLWGAGELTEEESEALHNTHK